MEPPATITTVAAPEAPVGSADPSRRFALVFPDGRVRFPGLAADEAEDLSPALAAVPPHRWDLCLVEVSLPVLLSDGAGPYLLDHMGRLTLALAPHPHIEGAHVAMGAPAPGHRVGAVARTGIERLWEWLADAVVAPERRVDALDGLDDADDADDLARWERREREWARLGAAP